MQYGLWSIQVTVAWHFVADAFGENDCKLHKSMFFSSRIRLHIQTEDTVNADCH